jgi:4a-hydroxytetrahydrobiopterin dehydratase
MSILSDQAIRTKLQQLDVAWTAIGNDYLVRNFPTKDFNEGVQLVNKVAEVAEACQHHPEVRLSYNDVEVRVSTHDVAGVTDKDLVFAAALDKKTQ